MAAPAAAAIPVTFQTCSVLAAGVAGSTANTEADGRLMFLTAANVAGIIGAVNAILANAVTKAEWDNMSTADGMTGAKYRQLILTCIDAYLTAVPGGMDQTNRALFTIVLAGLLGIVKNKDRAYNSILTATHPLLVHVRNFLNTICKTYVAEPSATRIQRVSTVKVPDSLPDYAMLGVLMINHGKVKGIPAGTITNWATLPEFLKKQFLGNFHLSAQVQQDHFTWEQVLWDTNIRKSRNQVAGAFNPGFHQEFYATRMADTFQLLNLDGTRTAPAAATGYTYAELDAYIQRFIRDTAAVANS